MNYEYAIQPVITGHHNSPHEVVMSFTNGETETFCQCQNKAIAEKRARRYNAIREYHQLDGQERLALMIMCDVEYADGRVAYDTCIDYITEKHQRNAIRCLLPSAKANDETI